MFLGSFHNKGFEVIFEASQNIFIKWPQLNLRVTTLN